MDNNVLEPGLNKAIIAITIIGYLYLPILPRLALGSRSSTIKPYELSGKVALIVRSYTVLILLSSPRRPTAQMEIDIKSLNCFLLAAHCTVQ